MIHTITRRMEFDAGHRVYGHESKCKNLHGHRYVVEVECTSGLDSIGRVIDFSVIKDLCGSWIDENLDHGMLLWKKDPLVEYWQGGFDFEGSRPKEDHKFYLMDKNPTAENIAEMLYWQFTQLLISKAVRVVQVTVQETPNCRAVYKEG